MENKNRWRAAQTKEKSFWVGDGVLSSEMQRVVERYKPVIEEISGALPDEAAVLDLGCGPTCAGRFFTQKNKTFLDPLMDSYLNEYGDKLPEGEKISSGAENIPKEDNSFDAVICLNALDHMANPEKVLLEVKRVLKNDGLFAVGLFLHPNFLAALRMFVEKFLPWFREDAHPYSYSLKSARNLLSIFFTIENEIKVYGKKGARFPSLHREDRIFICKNKN